MGLNLERCIIEAINSIVDHMMWVYGDTTPDMMLSIITYDDDDDDDTTMMMRMMNIILTCIIFFFSTKAIEVVHAVRPTLPSFALR